MEKSLIRRLQQHTNAILPKHSAGEAQYELKLLHENLRFIYAIEKMPKEQALEILEKVEEQDRLIELLEKYERDISQYPSDKYIQQQFYEECDWFYPDEDYIRKIKSQS